MSSDFYQYKPFKFFFLAILGTWACWFPAAFLSFEPSSNIKNLELQLLLLGLFPPALAALYLSYSSHNSRFKEEFKDKFSIRIINKDYLPIILLLIPIVLFLAIVLSLILKQVVFQNLSEIWGSFTMPSKKQYWDMFLILPIPILEEIAWRGYGIDSLRSKFNLFNASLIFAVLSASWHFPLLFINHWDTNPIYIVNFFLGLIPFSIIINWIYYRNNRSIIAAIIVHFYIDLAEIVLKGDYLSQILMTILLIFFSVIVIFKYKDLFFSRVRAL